MSRICHTGQGPLKLAGIAKRHLCLTTALCPCSSGQSSCTSLVPAVPCSVRHLLLGPCLWEVSLCLALGVPAVGIRGAGDLLEKTRLNLLWLWLQLPGDK